MWKINKRISMLNKINHIKNIARFYDVMPTGTSTSDPSFHKFTLIYAENGTGKSAISSILKSLDTQDPTPILTKHTISGTGPSEVSLRVNDRDCVFVNDNWRDATDTKILIFDEEFVQRNVFTTSGVDASNKRELFNYVILGEENYEKIEEINAIVEELSILKKEITPLETLLKKESGTDNIDALLETEQLSKEDFEELKKSVEELNIQIKSSEQIKAQAKLDKIKDLDWIDPEEALSKDIEVIGDIAEYRAHLQEHQDWLQRGQEIQGETPTCPYCFQNTQNSEAVKAYRQYFSEECQVLVSEVKDLQAKSVENFNDDKISLILATIKTNEDRCAFWGKLAKDIDTSITFDEAFTDNVKKYRAILQGVLNKKAADTLNKVALSVEEQEALNAQEQLKDDLVNYNLRVDEENEKIKSLKDQQSSIDDIKEQYHNKTLSLKCNKTAFYDDEIATIFNEYKQKIGTRKSSKERLDILKNEIQESSINTLEEYQKSINSFLHFINVDFRISKVEKRADSTSKETLVYAIELRGESFDPNGSKSNPYNLSNTLSSGDRSTLAFAFFLAKLENANLENTILVFDDPITSLDFFRKQQTSKKIIGLAAKAVQVIVLTHSIEFCKLFRSVRAIRKKYFKINKVRSASGVIFTPYDKLEDMITNKHRENSDKIISFLSDPTSVNRISVMKAIRGYVETSLCNFVPELSDVHPATLGYFIGFFRNNNFEENYIEILELINDSVVSENHGVNDPLEDEYANLTDDELTNICILAKELTAPPVSSS